MILEFIKAALGVQQPTQVQDTDPLPIYNAGPPAGSALLYSAANVSFSASGENVAIAGVALQTVKVYGALLTFASPVDVTIKDAAGGNVLGVYQAVTNLTLDPFAGGSPRFTSAVAGAFIVSLGAAVACKGTVWYRQA
jgi:hypothetical protein